MGQIFNEKVVEKWSLWDPWTVIAEKSKHVVEKKKKKKKKKRKETQTWIRKRKSKRILSSYPLSIVTKKKKKGDIIGKVGYCVYKYMFFFI